MGYSYKRSARVSDLILKEISNMLTKGEIKDPRVSALSLTGIRVSDDLSYAKIYFSPLIDIRDKKEISKGLESASGYIKTQLSKRLRMKKVPNIEFEYDHFIDKSQRLDQIIKDANEN